MDPTTPHNRRSRRQRVGITLEQLAVAARCSFSTARIWELGTPVRPELGARLESALEKLTAERRRSS